MRDTINAKTAAKPFCKCITIFVVGLLLAMGLMAPSEAFAAQIQGAANSNSGVLKAGISDSGHTGVDIGNKKSSGGGSRSSGNKSSSGSSKKSSSSSSSKNKVSSSSTATAAKSYAYLSAMRHLNRDDSAEAGSSTDEEGPLFSGNPPVVFDSAGVLSESEIAELEQSCEQFSKQEGYGIYIALFNGLETDNFYIFSNEYFDGEGYGLGDLNGGVLLVVDLADEESIRYCSNISSSAIDTLWDDQMLRDVGYRFASEDFYGGCELYISMIEQALLYFDNESTSLELIDSMQYVIDECGLIPGAGYEDLSSRCRELTEQTDTPIYVATVETIGEEDPEEFLLRYIQEHGLGFGEDYNGFVALFVADTGKIYLRHQEDFSPYYVEEEINGIVEATSSVEFEDAPEAFVAGCEDAIARYEEATNRAVNRDLTIFFFVLMAIAAVIVVRTILKRSHKPKRQEWKRPDYEREGSFVLTESNDNFCGEKNVRY